MLFCNHMVPVEDFKILASRQIAIKISTLKSQIFFDITAMFMFSLEHLWVISYWDMDYTVVI